jgi:hypothetical protein
MVESARHPRRATAPIHNRGARASLTTAGHAEAVIDTARLRSLCTQPRDWITHWRRDVRPRAVGLIEARTQTLSWSPALLALVLEELGTDDLFAELVGTARTIPRRRYAQALAVAIAIRHSWRPDSLAFVAKRLGLRLTRFALCRGTTFHPAPPRPASRSHPTKTTRRRSSAAEKGRRA